MKLLLEGSLNQSLQLKDLLSGIFQAEASGLTALKFTVDKEERGQLYFWGGHYIVYAELPVNTAAGTAALDELLKLNEADFVYYACDASDQLPPKSNLKIDLKELIESWRQAAPVSEGQLLDKIFNFGSAANSTQARINVLQAEVSATQTAKSEPAFTAGSSSTPTLAHMGWDLVEPLVSDGPPKPGYKMPSLFAGYHNFASHYVQKLRVTALNAGWQRKLRRVSLVIIMFLVTIIVIMCCVWLLLTAPSARLRPSRYAVPIERRNLNRIPEAENNSHNFPSHHWTK